MTRALPSRSIDPLGEALHSLRMKGTFYCRSELTAPWGLGMPAMPGCLWFHVVTAGRATLHCEGREPVEMLPGDLLMIPHGRGHDLRSHPAAVCPDVTELPQEYISQRYSLLKYGDGGDATHLICGVAQLDHPLAADVLGLLPPLVHLDAASASDASSMESTLRLIVAEAKALRPGGETIITRLSDVLVIQAIRVWLETASQAKSGWVGALRDRQIGRPITMVHREPQRDWSVASLAAAAGMSRSGFAARFKDLVGESPMQHVTRVRMKLAQGLLREEHTTVAELAARMGYQSEAAFSRAFKRFVGVSPGAVRRTAA